MHICLVTPEYPPLKHGGIGSVNHDLAEGLVKAGHRVTIIGLFPSQELKDGRDSSENLNGVTVIRLADSMRRGWPYRMSLLWDRWRLHRRINQMQRRDRFDVVECSDYDGLLPWGGVKGVPLVIRLHGSNALYDTELARKGNDFLHSLERKMLNRADYWVGVSQYAFDRTLSLCGRKNWPGEVIYNAIDTQLFAPNPEVAVEKGLVVFVNALTPRKGVEELIQAANLLVTHPLAHFVIIGGDSGKKDGEGRTYADRLKAMVRPEMVERVVFTGRLARHNGVLNYLRKAQACCYPSHIETFGVAPIEAMVLGKPTIFSRTGPGPEVIEHGVSGLLCDPRSPRDIAEKISQLLDDPGLADRLARAGRERVLERFSRSDWIPRNVAFFERCVAEFRKM